jgi:methionine--tRNA ligase beta chain
MDPIKPGKPLVKFDDFSKLDLRVARVLECREHPNADKLLILKVDLGNEQRQICSAIKTHYQPESLVGKLVVVVANLEPRSQRGEASQGTLLVARETGRDGSLAERMIVVSLLDEAAPGSAVS